MTVGSIVVALVVVGVLIYANRPGSSVNDDPYEPIERSQVAGKIVGDPNAPVRIITYEDFQCPFCRRFAVDTAPSLESEFVETGIASIEYRHVAFLGNESVQAAAASECANDQGFFWDYHDVLFLRQGAENAGVYSMGNLKGFAREVDEALPALGIDLGAFDDCLDSGRHEATVEQETEESSQLIGSLTRRVSTPSFLVNGQVLQGAQPIEVFRELIETIQGSDDDSSESG